jgi:hypothetical protein
MFTGVMEVTAKGILGRHQSFSTAAIVFAITYHLAISIPQVETSTLMLNHALAVCVSFIQVQVHSEAVKACEGCEDWFVRYFCLASPRTKGNLESLM